MIFSRVLARARLWISSSQFEASRSVGRLFHVKRDRDRFSGAIFRWYASQAASSLLHNPAFSLMPTDYMYIMKCPQDQPFDNGKISPYGNIELSPSACVLNYGQGLLEGLKAFRKENGNLLLFRPEQNAMRMIHGAERMCMTSPTIDQFLDAVKQTAIANKRWASAGRKRPYPRVGPAPEYTFLIYASPVHNYFKEGTAPLNLYVEDEFDRASQGGTGGVKTTSNYAPVMKALTRAKERGFSDVLYLDSVNRKNIEEVSASNIFMRKGNILSTPMARGTILSGITRRSVIELSRDLSYQVEERQITVEELLEADEIFCTGTAVTIASVGSITYQNRKVEFKTKGKTACRELYELLVGIQTGQIEDKHGWVIEID
ncbi:hypothetical protein MLD38_000958 [Melastoma candidum]|uniref:Uncharacterized protein n=1 Tax=Melastoma candidum TaxID=119954 RepID=A0ACB9SBL4_9MYRT|nr:hypothetical protein MLD38_000958 [Melastoma candidum]